jgi:hypothetical protein
MINPIASLIKWLTGSNGRTQEIKMAEEQMVQQVKDETLVNFNRAETNFRMMKECSGDVASEAPE